MRLLIVMVLASLLGMAVTAPVLAQITSMPQPLTSPAPVPLLHEGTQADVSESVFTNLPLRFIANRGQWDASVQFAVHEADHATYFTPRQVIFSVAGQGDATVPPVRLSFLGARTSFSLEGITPLPGSVHFFVGNNPASWRMGVPSYAAIVYRNLYPGVDLVYSGSHGQLKSEFRLAPGAHPGLIHLAYEGVEDVHVLPDGSLRLRTMHGELIEAAPLAYQEADGIRRTVTARYVVLAAPLQTPFLTVRLPALVRFEVRDYDPRWTLVIDPVLRYASFLGGSQAESGNAIAVDDAGNVYIAGGTLSNDFPVYTAIQTRPRGSWDAFVTQLVRMGEVYTYGFSTYLGGSGPDLAHDIAVSSSGDAVTIVGETASSDFPIFNAPQTVNRGYVDAFVTRLITRSGVITLDYSTYLGGNGIDIGHAVALDSAGDVVVVGETTSRNLFTTTTAVQPFCGESPCFRDAFVTRIANSSGYTFTYSSYLGGRGADRAWAVAVDTTDDAIFVTGETGSPDFPLRNAPQPVWGVAGLHLPTAELEAVAAITYPDGFVTQITTSGGYTYAYSTYLGGTFVDGGRGIVVDSSGNAWVTGHTGSTDFPRTPNAVQPTYGGGAPIGLGGDAFLTHIVNAGGVYTFGYSTFLGGSRDEVGYDLILDGNDNPVVVGKTLSGDFPTRYPIQSHLRGAADAFVTQLISTTAAYTLGLSTYLGGSGLDDAYGVAVDAVGDIYITGQTASADFPTVQALDASHSGTTDAFVTRIGWGGLMISKTATPTLVAPGRAVTYTLVFTNDSPTLAQNVVISDYLPIPVIFSDASYVSSGAIVTPTGSFSYTWRVDDLAQGKGGTIQISAVLSNALAPGMYITNTAVITGSGAYTSSYSVSTAVITVGHGIYLPIISKQP
ncbi:MAG: SBBP repeat-containing protein [Anaerolineae bacterium]|nr:SBBP repeat-containing protein [Anaerolineae bacterium]MDW8071044.1 SBBP repeat-containing protein [Anaerolineae bacterium]